MHPAPPAPSPDPAPQTPRPRGLQPSARASGARGQAARFTPGWGERNRTRAVLRGNPQLHAQAGVGGCGVILCPPGRCNAPGEDRVLRPPGQSTASGPCPRCPAAREEKEESIPCVRNPTRILISAAPRRGALIAHNWAASCWKLKGAGWGMRQRWKGGSRAGRAGVWEGKGAEVGVRRGRTPGPQVRMENPARREPSRPGCRVFFLDGNAEGLVLICLHYPFHSSFKSTKYTFPLRCPPRHSRQKKSNFPQFAPNSSPLPSAPFVPSPLSEALSPQRVARRWLRDPKSVRKGPQKANFHGHPVIQQRLRARKWPSTKTPQHPPGTCSLPAPEHPRFMQEEHRANHPRQSPQPQGSSSLRRQAEWF